MDPSQRFCYRNPWTKGYPAEHRAGAGSCCSHLLSDTDLGSSRNCSFSQSVIKLSITIFPPSFNWRFSQWFHYSAEVTLVQVSPLCKCCETRSKGDSSPCSWYLPVVLTGWTRNTGEKRSQRTEGGARPSRTGSALSRGMSLISLILSTLLGLKRRHSFAAREKQGRLGISLIYSKSEQMVIVFSLFVMVYLHCWRFTAPCKGSSLSRWEQATAVKIKHLCVKTFLL